MDNTDLDQALDLAIDLDDYRDERNQRMAKKKKQKPKQDQDQETEQTELQQELLPVVAKVGALKIKDDADFIQAGNLAQTIKGLQAQVDDTFGEIVKSANDTHKKSLAGRDKHMKPLKAAEDKIKESLADYFRKRTLEARVDQAETQAELREEVQDSALDEAAALEKAGRKDEAEQVLANAETAVLPGGMMGSELPKLKGVNFRTMHKGRVVDQSKLDPKFLKPDQAAIDKVADALGKDADIAGVEIYAVPVVSIRKPKADA